MIKDKISAFFLGESVFEPFMAFNKSYNYRPIGRAVFVFLYTLLFVYIIHKIEK